MWLKFWRGSGIVHGQISKVLSPRKSRTALIEIYGDRITSTLIEVAEKLGWPMSTNYAAATPNDRNTFENAFLNLLKLQTM